MGRRVNDCERRFQQIPITSTPLHPSQLSSMQSAEEKNCEGRALTLEQVPVLVERRQSLCLIGLLFEVEHLDPPRLPGSLSSSALLFLRLAKSASGHFTFHQTVTAVQSPNRAPIRRGSGEKKGKAESIARVFVRGDAGRARANPLERQLKTAVSKT